MDKTLKQFIKEAAEHYDRHADWEKGRMKYVTSGSSNERELLQAYEFNRGRAAAMREVLNILDKFIG